METLLFPTKSPDGLTHGSEKLGAQSEESHAPRICRIWAATINELRENAFRD